MSQLSDDQLYKLLGPFLLHLAKKMPQQATEQVVLSVWKADGTIHVSTSLDLTEAVYQQARALYYLMKLQCEAKEKLGPVPVLDQFLNAQRRKIKGKESSPDEEDNS